RHVFFTFQVLHDVVFFGLGFVLWHVDLIVSHRIQFGNGFFWANCGAITSTRYFAFGPMVSMVDRIAAMLFIRL
ncbi:MAG: hypothetical protein ACWGMZ_05660, partial [Thermoguttaceae bacterium]